MIQPSSRSGLHALDHDHRDRVAGVVQYGNESFPKLLSGLNGFDLRPSVAALPTR
jgi:hypothetical protein